MRLAAASGVLLLLIAAMSCDVGSTPVLDPQSERPTARTTLEQIVATAEALYGRGQYDSARTSYQAALERAAALGDTSAIARTLTSLGLAAWRLGDYSDARRLGEQALAIKHERKMHADLFRSYNALGLLAHDEGRLDVAGALFDTARTVARATGDRIGAAKVTSNKALVSYDLGDFEVARTEFVDARDAARQLGEMVTEWNATVGLASVDVRLGAPLAAIDAVEDLRRRYPHADHPVGEENAYAQLATAYDLLGETQRAIASLDTAIRIARASGLRVQEGEDLELLAEIYEKTGDRRRALTMLDEAFRLDSSVGAPDEVASVLLRRATVLGELGDAARARESAARALSMHRAMNARFDVLTDLLVDAELAARSGDRAGARSRLVMAARLSDTLRSAPTRTLLALTSARIADHDGESRRVLTILAAAKPELFIGGVAAQFEAEALAARAYGRLGELDAAVAHGTLAVAAVERVRTSLGDGELRTALLTEKAPVYADLVLSLLRLGRVSEALEVADGSRSRALLERLARARVRDDHADSTSATLGERARVLHAIDVLMRRLSANNGGVPRDRGASSIDPQPALAAELAARRREFDELLVRYPGTQSDAPTTGFDRPRAGVIRAALREDETLVEYFVTDEQLAIFSLDRRGTRVAIEKMSATDLTGRVRLARDLLAAGVREQRAPTDASADAVLRGLYRTLIEPVVSAEGLGASRRLIIVPHGALAYLPFAALKSKAGRALVEDYSLLYLPVAAALPALRARSDERVGERLRIAAFAPFPTTLASSRGEANRVAATRDGSSALLGSAATEKALRAALQAGAIVHVASHGVMDVDSPMFSRIELARGSGTGRDNGRLEVHELLPMRIASPLVFLSGCETGIGGAWSSRYARADDHATLEQAFLYSGARTVVATRWRVEDESAAALADRFYSHLANGDAAEALALAQRDLIRDHRYAAPHFWAAYAVSGAGSLQGAPIPAVVQVGGPRSARRSTP
jgi:CHAT domain-containing protein/Tfp pilus assembly protein PilF